MQSMSNEFIVFIELENYVDWSVAPPCVHSSYILTHSLNFSELDIERKSSPKRP